MSQRQPIHICFYSNRCKWSKAFLQELAQTPWKGDFRFVCADPSPTRPKLPDWLKSVPTIVISGEPEPRVGADVMNWLYEKKMKEAATTTDYHENTKLLKTRKPAPPFRTDNLQIEATLNQEQENISCFRSFSGFRGNFEIPEHLN